MNNNTLENELNDKINLIHELRKELEETNKGILILVMELENASEKRINEENAVIKQLQNELALTDQGLLALAMELDIAKEKYRNILEHAREAIFTFDDQFKIESFNKAALQLFGFEEKDLLGMSLNQIIPGFDLLFQNSLKSGQDDMDYYKTSTDNEHNLYGQTINQHIFPVEMTLGSPFYTEKKTWMVIVRDITERKNTEYSLKLLAKVFEDSNEAILITDHQSNIIDVNQAFSNITGFDRQDVIGQNLIQIQADQHSVDFYKSIWELLTISGKWNGEVWDKKKNGQVYPKWLSISSVLDANKQISHFICIFTDISQQKESERKLLQLAHFDQLTGLPNRSLFLEKLHWNIELATRKPQQIALLFLDLDRFKIINDTLGHHAGDQVLIDVANRLKESTRKTDMICRLAGDEFTIVLTEIKDIHDIENLVKKIISTFTKPIIIGEREIYVTCSLGISIYPDDGENIDLLLNNADTAMYHAKKLGKNTFAFYSKTMNEHIQDELELGANLRKSLVNNAFMLYYQPQLDLNTNQIIGFEALIRWKHPKGGFISPSLFIPFAEQSDLILHIGNWVLRTACNQFVEWFQAGFSPIKISVNYSGVQLKQSNQIENVTKILAETGMNPNYLCLELTESVAMENAENTINALHAFKKMGISISIDDFGTGYSSLSYLKRFPIDVLKIDRSFIKDFINNQDDREIVATIIAIAHQLKLLVIAEGVESLDQLEFLKTKACDQIQGYYFCYPVPAKEAIEFLQQHLKSS